MNHLTTLYVNQADREREVADDLRNRQILHAEALAQAEAPAHTDAARRGGLPAGRRAASQAGSALSARTAIR